LRSNGSLQVGLALGGAFFQDRPVNTAYQDLPQTGLCHGDAGVAGRVLLFSNLESADTGLVALIGGVKGGTEVARSRVTGDLAPNPEHDQG
jgi:hypothetical protein